MNRRKSQIALEFMILYSLVLVIFIVIFAYITMQRAVTLSSQQSISLQMQTQNIASIIDTALASGNGYTITMPLAGSILNTPFNLYASSTGVIFANMSIGTETLNAQAFSAARNLNIGGRLLPISTSGVSVYQIPTTTGTISIANSHGTIYIDSQPPQSTNFTASLTNKITSAGVADFNGVDYVYGRLTSYYGANNPLTAVAWAYLTPSANGPIFGVASTPPDSGWNMPFLSEDGLTVFGWIWSLSQLSYTVNSPGWYMLAITYNPGGSGNTILYVNGNAVGSTTGEYSPSGSTDYWTTYISGAKPSGVVSNYNSMLANVQAYSINLTAPQIMTLYKEGIGGIPVNTLDLVSWWPLNYSASDYSGNGNNGVSLGINYSTFSTVKVHASLLNGSKAVNERIGFISNARKVNNTRIALSELTDSNGNATAFVNSSINSLNQKLFINSLMLNSSIANNIRLWLPLDSYFNGTAYDLSGAYNNGTFVQSSFSPMPLNASSVYTVHFNGQSSYVNVASSPSLNVSYITISAWVYIPSYICSSSPEIIVNKENSYEFGISCSSGYLSSAIQPNWAWYSSPNPVPLNKWVFVAVSWDGSHIRQYMNGVLVYNTTLTSGPISSTSACLRIGARNGCGLPNSFFNGSITNVQIYNTALSPQQISQLYKGGLTGVPINNQGLAGWWPLDGNTNDYSNFKNNGTATNVVYTNYKFNQFNPNIYVANFSGTGSQSVFAAKIPLSNLGFNFAINQWFMLKPGSGTSPIIDLYNGSAGSGVGGGQNFDFGGTWATTTSSYGTIPSKSFGYGAYYPTDWQFCSAPAGTIHTGVWYDGLVVVSGYTNITVYIDGVKEANCQISASTSTVSTYSTNLMLAVGSNPPGGLELANAYISDVELYSKVLNAQQAEQLYQQGLPLHSTVNISSWSI